MTSTPLPLGAFCWPELATSDPAAAVAFYGNLLGWTATDMGGYTILQKDGRSVAGLYGLKDAARRPEWLSYVKVASTDDLARRILEAGGHVTAGPLDVPGVGRMAEARDPQGARFALWESRGHEGVQAFQEPGALCWTELMVPDAEAARTFYGGLFPWRPEVKDMGPHGSYTEWHLREGGLAFGGLMAMAEAPPQWLVYWQVEDLDGRAAAAEAAGAAFHVRPADIPGVGRFCILADPQGAVSALIQMAPR